jgi:hypothetical protein
MQSVIARQFVAVVSALRNFRALTRRYKTTFFVEGDSSPSFVYVFSFRFYKLEQEGARL